MKKFLIFLFLIMMTLSSYPITIEKITSIDNPTQVIDYNVYVGSILQYENRLIVRNRFSYDDLEILFDGQLKRLGLIETHSQSGSSIMDEKKYYHITGHKNIPFRREVNIFDLSSSSMKYLTSFDISPFTSHSSVFFTEEHIVYLDYGYQRAVLINKNTLNEDIYIDGLFGYLVVKIGSNIVIYKVIDEIHTLHFYEILDEKNLYLIELSTLTIHNVPEGIIDMRILNDFLVISHWHGAMVVDINDFSAPFILHELWLPYGVYDAIFYDNMFFTVYNTVIFQASFNIHRLNDSGNFTLVLSEEIFNASIQSLHLQGQYLYVNAGFNLKVYDIYDNFNVVSEYGQDHEIHYIAHSQNSMYHIANTFNSDIYDIYSVLDDRFICRVILEPSYLYNTVFMAINNNNLYVHRSRNGQPTLDIYQIIDETAILKNRISSIYTNELYFYLTETQVFFYYYPYEVGVYDIEGFDIVFNRSMQGRSALYSPNGNVAGNHLLMQREDELFIYDFNDLSSILHTFPFNAPNVGYSYHDDNTFIVANYSFTNPTPATVFYYDISDGSINSIHRFSPDERVRTFNGVITVNQGEDSKASDYYSIINGGLVKIGEMSYERQVRETYFFPEMKKMVQVARSGIWVYDIEFDEYLSDFEPVISPLNTELLGNFPNPFNPETTIEFIIRNSEFGVRSYAPPMKNEWGGEGWERVTIDIFNIRGQKVRSLLDGLFESGSHSVVWDGRDDSGRELGSGVYLYRMVAGEETSVRKMVLLK